MWDTVKLVALGLIALLAAIAANYARDLAYMVHAILIMIIAGGMFLWQVRKKPGTPGQPCRKPATWTRSYATA